MTIYAYTDGASRGNPGESGIGIVLRDEQGNVLFEGGGYIGTATNNIAEYQALLACMKKAKELSCKKLIVYSDSQLMVRQLRGEYRVKDAKIRQQFTQAKELLKTVPFTFEIIHIEREHNSYADELANAGIDNKEQLKV